MERVKNVQRTFHDFTTGGVGSTFLLSVEFQSPTAIWNLSKLYND